MQPFMSMTTGQRGSHDLPDMGPLLNDLQWWFDVEGSVTLALVDAKMKKGR